MLFYMKRKEQYEHLKEIEYNCYKRMVFNLYNLTYPDLMKDPKFVRKLCDRLENSERFIRKDRKIKVPYKTLLLDGYKSSKYD